MTLTINNNNCDTLSVNFFINSHDRERAENGKKFTLEITETPHDGENWQEYKSEIYVNYSEIINGDALKGFSGLLFANQSPSGPAKVLKEFRKSLDSDHPSLKVASIESDIFVGDNHLDSLSKLKGKEEIIGDIVLLLQSPAKNIISLLKSSENKISGVVKALENKQE